MCLCVVLSLIITSLSLCSAAAGVYDEEQEFFNAGTNGELLLCMCHST